MLPYNRKLKRRSQGLRTNATPQENKLWYEYLREHPAHFSRQKPIDQFIVDFFCASKKLVIEVDGNQHYTADELRYDSTRTAVLEALGLRVLRFSNYEITHCFNKVCATIQNNLDS